MAASQSKNKLSNLVDKAHREGPQIVTKHGKEDVVIMAVEDYQILNRPTSGLVPFVRKSPPSEACLELTRGKSASREGAL